LTVFGILHRGTVVNQNQRLQHFFGYGMLIAVSFDRCRSIICPSMTAMFNYPFTNAKPSSPQDRIGTVQPVQGNAQTGDSPSRSTLATLDYISMVMDRWLPVPGTRWRVGLNSLLWLLPVVGDTLATAVSFGILVVGLGNYRVPRIVAARMTLNTLVDTVLGWVPVVGDIFDFFFKADTRNVRLLQEYINPIGQTPTPLWRHWVFVLSLLGGLVLIVAMLVLGVVAMAQWLANQRTP
jgi:hypothetical protein